MSAPLPPRQPHQPGHDGAVQEASGASAAGQAGSSGTAAGPPLVEDGGGQGDSGTTEYRRGLWVLLAVAVFGVVVGLLWWWLAPRVPLISDGKSVYIKDSEGEQQIGQDGTFALLAAAAGLLCGIAVFCYRRRGGVAVVLGLAVGGLLGSLLAWQLGVLLGPTGDIRAHAREAGSGTTFDKNLELHLKGALLLWPMLAMAAHLALTAGFGPRQPRVSEAAQVNLEKSG